MAEDPRKKKISASEQAKELEKEPETTPTPSPTPKPSPSPTPRSQGGLAAFSEKVDTKVGPYGRPAGAEGKRSDYRFVQEAFGADLKTNEAKAAADLSTKLKRVLDATKDSADARIKLSTYKKIDPKLHEVLVKEYQKRYPDIF